MSNLTQPLVSMGIDLKWCQINNHLPYFKEVCYQSIMCTMFRSRDFRTIKHLGLKIF